MDYVLRAQNLCKTYKKRAVLNGVDMHIQRGDIYGFVGENGSGKTTVIRLITGLISPNDGNFELFGIPSTSPEILQARKKVGAIVESPSIYLNMSAYDNLKMQSGILGIENEEKIKQVLSEVGLAELFSDPKQAGNYSLGMRQRLGIAMALLGEPEFIILDEPMNGLDPAGIVEIRELILHLNKEKNITFLIYSHILTELALVATKYGIISKGKILKEITAEELKQQCRKTTLIESENLEALYQVLSKTFPREDLAPAKNGIKVFGEHSLNATLSKLLEANVNITSINCSEATIGEYYLSVIGGSHHA